MRLFALILLACLASSASANAAGAPAPMDAAAQQQATDHLPDMVTQDGMHIGSWSSNTPAGSQTNSQAGSGGQRAAAAPQQPQSQAAAPDGMNVGSWSASGQKSATPAGDSNAIGEHSYVVTSIQSCYDQLDPADVADIKKNFLKPYAECQARVEAKANAKKEFKAGETAKAATPESPRNYIRVQAPDAPAPAANTSDKSGIKTNP